MPRRLLVNVPVRVKTEMPLMCSEEGNVYARIVARRGGSTVRRPRTRSIVRDTYAHEDIGIEEDVGIYG
jgi:hypothetical protein